MSFGARAHSLEQIGQVAQIDFGIAEIEWKDARTIRDQWDKLLILQKRYSLTYLAHGPNEKDRSDADEIAEQMAPRVCRLLDLASEMGIRTYTQHLCLDARSLSEETVRRKIDVLKLWAEYAARRGVMFCIENLSEHPHHFALAFELIPELYMTLDVGHGELLTERNNSAGFVESFPERIHHAHLHDNNGGDSSKSDLHLPIGEGSIDILMILGKLLAAKYAGVLSLEVPIASMEESRARLQRMADTIASSHDGPTGKTPAVYRRDPCGL